MSRARKQDRFSSTLAVSYREPTSSEPSLGTCADISPSGMFIETARPAARGVLVRFECVSQATQGVVRGTARVMWLRPHNEATGKAGMGVRFVRLEPGSARVIEELIAHANTSGTRARSDGPEARATTEEPSVVLTAERTIGPTNRSSSVPPKGLRAPTLRGMYPTDVRSVSSAPPPKERKSFDSGPPREPVAHSGSAPRSTEPRSADEPEHRSSRPPGDNAGSHSQALRERLDRSRRGDETPTGSHRTEQPAAREVASEAAAGPDPHARVTAPDGSLIDPQREKDAPAAARSLGATMHDTAQPSKLSKSGARRGSDNTLGVPSPPPPPWKARHSERPPGPGGVEVIRSVPVTTDMQGQPVASAAPPSEAAHSSGAASNVAEVVDAIPAGPASELPGAGDPSPADWEPMTDSGRPAMRPDRPPPDVSEPFVLPASTDQLDSLPGRNWIPWFVVGSGLLVTVLITIALGSPSLRLPSFKGTSDTKSSDPLSAENAFAPQKPAETKEPAEPKQVFVQAQVKPLGAKVSALDESITSPGTLALAYESVTWPLRVRMELAGHGAAEVVLPRQAFTSDGDSIVHELYLELQPFPARAPQPVVTPEPRPEPSRKPSTKPSRPTKPPPPPKPSSETAPSPTPAPSMTSTPPPGTQEPPPDQAAQTPLARALECLSRGDNACVLQTLGNASGARELELLIETYRATGDGSSAEAAMRRYLQVHPEGKRAAQYRRALGVLAPLPEPKPE